MRPDGQLKRAYYALGTGSQQIDDSACSDAT